MSGGGVDPALVTNLDKSLGQLVWRERRCHTAAWSARVPGDSRVRSTRRSPVVASYPPANLGAIGRAASLDKSTTADVVLRLVRHGWLRPDPEAPSGRARSHALTAPAEDRHGAGPRRPGGPARAGRAGTP